MVSTFKSSGKQARDSTKQQTNKGGRCKDLWGQGKRRRPTGGYRAWSPRGVGVGAGVEEGMGASVCKGPEVREQVLRKLHVAHRPEGAREAQQQEAP